MTRGLSLVLGVSMEMDEFDSVMFLVPRGDNLEGTFVIIINHCVVIGLERV